MLQKQLQIPSAKIASSDGVKQLILAYKADRNAHVAPDWKPKPGFTYVLVRAISARINQNYDAWPSEELKKTAHLWLGRPIFVNHNNFDPSRARGVVIAARYLEKGADKFIETIMEVDSQRFPKLAKELREGGLDSVSMGVEAGFTICSICNGKATDIFDMCDHVKYHKGEYLPHVKTGKRTLCYENCYKLSWFELSFVFDPADETAVVSRVIAASRRRADVDDFDKGMLDPTHDHVMSSDGGGGGGSPSGGSPSGASGPPSPGAAGEAGGHPGGGPPSQNLTEALQRAGIDPSMDPLISGFSATEGNNPSGVPTLGFTDSQAGSSLDDHAQALSKQITDRQSVAGEFPHSGTPEQQASWMATTVGQNGSPSDWQGNAQPARADYVNRIVDSMPTTPAAPSSTSTAPSSTSTSMSSGPAAPSPSALPVTACKIASESRMFAMIDKYAYGEVEAPEDVDTLRSEDDEDDEDFHHYVDSPEELQDPDLDQSKRLDRDQESGSSDGNRRVEDLNPKTEGGPVPGDNDDVVDDFLNWCDAQDADPDEESLGDYANLNGIDDNDFQDITEFLQNDGSPHDDSDGGPDFNSSSMPNIPGAYPAPHVGQRRNIMASRTRRQAHDGWDYDDYGNMDTSDIPSDHLEGPHQLPMEHHMHSEQEERYPRQGRRHYADDDDADDGDSEKSLPPWLQDDGGGDADSGSSDQDDDGGGINDEDDSGDAGQDDDDSGGGQDDSDDDDDSDDSDQGGDSDSGKSDDELIDEVEGDLEKARSVESRRRNAKLRSQTNKSRRGQKGYTMGRNSLAERGRVASRGRRRHYADDNGYTDGPTWDENNQGEQEDVFLSDTPPEETVEAPNEPDPISNTENNLVARIQRKTQDLKRDAMRLQKLKIQQASRRRQAGPPIGGAPPAAGPAGPSAPASGNLGLTVDPPAAPGSPESPAGSVAPHDFSIVGPGESDNGSLRTPVGMTGSRHRRTAEATEQAAEVPVQWSGTDDKELAGDFEKLQPDKVETQPKDASISAFRSFDKWLYDTTGRQAHQHNAKFLRRQAVRWMKGTRCPVEILGPALGIVLRNARNNEGRGASMNRYADEELELAAPDARIDVEAPVKNTTDEKAQSSQFDLQDFGDNAGDSVADPDLDTDSQIWAPGEGVKSANRKADAVAAVRYAEAAVRAGLIPEGEKYNCMAQAQTMRHAVVTDRTRLIEAILQKNSSRRTAGTSRGTRNGIPAGLMNRGSRTASTQRTAENDPANDVNLYF